MAVSGLPMGMPLTLLSGFAKALRPHSSIRLKLSLASQSQRHQARRRISGSSRGPLGICCLGQCGVQFPIAIHDGIDPAVTSRARGEAALY
jgi:hypothetical protein